MQLSDALASAFVKQGVITVFGLMGNGNMYWWHALDQYRTSSLFTDAERATLDYVTELTKEKKVDPETFARMARYYSEREICEIVWFVASEHLYNITNIGLIIKNAKIIFLSL